MSCCNPSISTFANELITTVAYTGNKPIVDVAYLQPDNTFQQMGIFTKIEITTTDVIIDHGGLASGIVKLLK